MKKFLLLLSSFLVLSPLAVSAQDTFKFFRRGNGSDSFA